MNHRLPLNQADMRPGRSGGGPLQMLRRIFRPRTLDFETASWEIFYLIFRPKRVYKNLYYHKQTKNKWARDDPSFFILLNVLLLISALGWGLAYQPGIVRIIRLMFYMVLVDFLLLGLVIAGVFYVVIRKFLTKKGDMFSQGALEYSYCFDVHCNGFLIVWLLLYVLQFVLLPVLTRDNWLALFVGNTLYAFSTCYYFLVTFYGYSSLPFLEHTEFILLPIPIILVFYIASLFGFNVVQHMVEFYFGT